VKRVVGLPGETIEIRKRDVYINGAKLNEPYAVHQDFHVYSTERWVPQDLQRRDNMEPRLIPPGHYFMMGDNRDNSADSRYWGFVPDNNIVGRAFFIWMNFSNLKRIGSFH
jgi:signal peptidase I